MFENTIRQELEQRLTLETELALAVERSEFELFYPAAGSSRAMDI